MTAVQVLQAVRPNLALSTQPTYRQFYVANSLLGCFEQADHRLDASCSSASMEKMSDYMAMIEWHCARFLQKRDLGIA